MKRLLLYLIFPILFSQNVFAQRSENETPYQTKTFTGKLTALRVETSGGSITIDGSSRDDVKVEVYVKANGWPRQTLSQAEINERLKQYDLVLRTEGNTVIATAKAKAHNMNWKQSLNIAFRVYTPRPINTNLSTSGGGITLSHLAGKQAFSTSGGGLNLTDLVGDLKGRTSGGSIRLTDCKANGSGDRIDLETSGGSIEATNAAGLVRLETSGGSIQLHSLNGTIKAETSGGSITGDDIAGELVATTNGGGIRLSRMAGSVEATTSAGSVNLELTKLGSYLRLSTSAGSVRVQMPLTAGLNLDVEGNRVTMPLRNFDGVAEKDRVKGKLNGGGIPVAISANSGNVSVNQ